MEDVTKQCEYMKSLTQEERQLIITTAVGINSNLGYFDSYAKQIAYKTGNYTQRSVADFNAVLASTPDELTQILAVQANVINVISFDDENYDFFTTMMDLSTNDLYCGYMGEDLHFSWEYQNRADQVNGWTKRGRYGMNLAVLLIYVSLTLSTPRNF